MPKGYSLGAMANQFWPCYQDALSGNLNSYFGRDMEGKYYQASTAAATTANNYPINEAGTLEVVVHNANAIGNSYQEYTAYSSGRRFFRTQASTSTAWGVWDEYPPLSRLYKLMYPVGSVLFFETGVNPNTLFPGTTWVQRTTGRAIRAANSATVGTAAGNIGATAGSDSVTLVIGQIPVHAHSMAHTHDITHQHSVPSHVHSMAHTHTIAHTHSMSHDHSNATAASAGSHAHVIDLDAQGMNSNAANGYGKIATGNDNTEGTFKKFNTNAGGAHTHTVDIPTFTGSTGGSSAANSGGSSAANTGGVTAFATTGGPTNTGGSSAANTGNAGGTASVNLTNSSVYYAVWARTA